MNPSICKGKDASLSRAILLPDKCDQEKKWFELNFDMPPGLRPDSFDTDLAGFKNLIWETPHDEILTKYGDTANDLAVLCSLLRSGWLMSSHVYHFMDMANEAQEEALCFCLPGPGPSNIKDLYLARPKTKTFFIVCNMLQVNGETVLATAQTPGNHWSLVVVDVDKQRIFYCDSLRWASPKNLMSILEKFFSHFDFSVVSMHISNPPYFPVQKCPNVCGVIAIIFTLIGAVDKESFFNIVNFCQGSHVCLRYPTHYEFFLRRVLMSWFVSKKIKLNLLFFNNDHTYCKVEEENFCIVDSFHYQDELKADLDMDSNTGPEINTEPALSLPKVSTKMVSCPYCKVFVSASNLNRHKRRLHANICTKNSNSNLLTCSECDNFSAPSIQSLIQHMQVTHNKDITINTRQFPNKDQFQEWKMLTEREKKIKFILERGSHTKLSIKTSYYTCNRSGRKVLKANSSKFSKTQGSCKLDHKCTSYLKVKENLNDGIINLEYCLDHVGHATELAHLSLSENVRKTVAVKLSQGIDPGRILDDVRDDVEEVDRDTLLTRRDIHNIKRQYQISQTQKHADDGLSVDLWVSSLKNEINNPVIFYKPQGVEHDLLKKEDFLLCIQTEFQKQMMKNFAKKLICIDSTHKTNQYDFYLTTISVVDDFEEGIPVAFAISNKEDSSTLTFFMQALKNSCNHDFEIDFFMSDLACNSYKAWCSVFSKPSCRLYCSWHVDKSWRKNIDELIKEPEDRQKTYNFLKLLQNTTHEIEFWDLFQIFSKYICTISKKFYDYFFKTYMNDDKVMHWAGCFRIGTLANTNMFAEAFHRVLKEIYFCKRQNRRVDFLLVTLLKISRDKSIEQLIKLEKGKVSHRVREVRIRHKNALDVKEIFKSSESEWVVASSSKKDVFYLVTKVNFDACSCKLVCDLCKVCVHMYTCACNDFLLKAVSCKHIHAVHMSEIKPFDSSSCSYPHTEIDVESKSFIKNDLSNSSFRKSHNEASLRFYIHKFNNELFDMLKDTRDTTILQEVKQIMKNARDITLALLQNKNKQAFKKTFHFSSNKNHDIQRRLFSTKKKRKKRDSKLKLKKPDHTNTESLFSKHMDQ